MDEDDLMKIGMAIRESVVNAVVHGNRYNAHKKVRFAVASDGQRFTVRIGDEGEGFDFGQLVHALDCSAISRPAKLSGTITEGDGCRGAP